MTWIITCARAAPASAKPSHTALLALPSSDARLIGITARLLHIGAYADVVVPDTVLVAYEEQAHQLDEAPVHQQFRKAETLF